MYTIRKNIFLLMLLYLGIMSFCGTLFASNIYVSKGQTLTPREWNKFVNSLQEKIQFVVNHIPIGTPGQVTALKLRGTASSFRDGLSLGFGYLTGSTYVFNPNPNLPSGLDRSVQYYTYNDPTLGYNTISMTGSSTAFIDPSGYLFLTNTGAYPFDPSDPLGPNIDGWAINESMTLIGIYADRHAGKYSFGDYVFEGSGFALMPFQTGLMDKNITYIHGQAGVNPMLSSSNGNSVNGIGVQPISSFSNYGTWNLSDYFKTRYFDFSSRFTSQNRFGVELPTSDDFSYAVGDTADIGLFNIYGIVGSESLPMGFHYVSRFGVSSPNTTAFLSFSGMLSIDIDPTTSKNIRLHLPDGRIIDLGPSFPANTVKQDFYEFRIYAPPGQSQIIISIENLLTHVTREYTSTVPSQYVGVLLQNTLRFVRMTDSNIAPSIDIMSLYLEVFE